MLAMDDNLVVLVD